MKQVTVYTTDSCVYCRQAERFLKGRGIPFKQVDVSGDDAARQLLVERSGGRKTVPQIFVGDQPIGGYTDMIALDRSKQLDALLADS